MGDVQKTYTELVKGLESDEEGREDHLQMQRPMDRGSVINSIEVDHHQNLRRVRECT